MKQQMTITFKWKFKRTKLKAQKIDTSFLAIMKRRMMVPALLCCFLLLLKGPVTAQTHNVIETDICIYGGTSAGVTAAIAARRMGKKVLIVEPKAHLGGLTAGGLGETDDGYRYSITGIAREFYRRTGAYYGRLENFSFEPHVAERVYMDMIREEKIPVFYHYRVISVQTRETKIREMVAENSIAPRDSPHITIRAKEFIDCSYEGDLMARTGVSYTYGREANSVYHETHNGVEPGGRHQFVNGVDPYKVEGDPASGLVWGVIPGPLAATGSGDKKIQAYCFRLCMTTDPDDKIPITRPPGYDSTHYELLARLIKIKKPTRLADDGILILSQMPGGKTDINSGWGAGMSTDYIMGNWTYPDASYPEREKIWQDHIDYTKGLIYFLATDPRVPKPLRQEMSSYGYPKDEYKDNDGFTHELYVREARRMIGAYVMTEHNCLGEKVAADGIADASYNMDSHNVQTTIVNGMVRNEGEVTVHLPKPYPVAYHAITPRKEECQNLLVPVCLSASHIAYGSIRMEPVFMELGQAAGMAASMAIDGECAVQDIAVSKLQQRQRNDPYLLNVAPDRYIFSTDTALVTTEGNWERRTDVQWASSVPFLYAQPAHKRTTIRFRIPSDSNQMLAVYLYNPVTTNGLSQQDIPVTIHHAGATDTVHISLGLNRSKNTCLISLGSYTFKRGDDNTVTIGNGPASVPLQAGYLVLVPEYWENFRKKQLP